MAKRFAVADEKLKVPRVRSIDMRIINLVHDAVTQREPDAATGVIGRANAFFALEVQRGSMPGAPNATELSGELMT